MTPRIPLVIDTDPGIDDALAILRAHAFATSTTMEVISAEVVEQRLGFTRTETGTWGSVETPRGGTTQEEEP